VRAPPIREHQHPHQALNDEERFGQDQRRAEAAAGRLLSKVHHQAPDADHYRDQEPGAKQAIVKNEQDAQEASSKPARLARAASSVAPQFLTLMTRRAAFGRNHRTSSTSESCGASDASPLSSTR
jgi:hypothetical protein